MFRFAATFSQHCPFVRGAWILVFIAAGCLALLQAGFFTKAEMSLTSIGHTISGVASVIDGDTIEIRGRRIRLHGIDAPESRQRCYTEKRQAWRCGQRASFALSNYLGRSNLNCDIRDTDRYGRSIAVCRKGGADVNAWMVENGWAVAYRRYSSDYVGAERRARSRRANIWSASFELPWDWRRAQRGR